MRIRVLQGDASRRASRIRPDALSLQYRHAVHSRALRLSPGGHQVRSLFHCSFNTLFIRMARGRDEWQSAILHNVGVQCNALLPLYGKEIAANNFDMCLVRCAQRFC